MKKILSFLILFSVFFSFLSSASVFASEGKSLRDVKFNPPSTLPTLGLDDPDNPVRDPLQVVDSIFLTYIINPIFFLAGGAAVIMIMYSSFRIITGRGEEDGFTAAKNALIWATAGLALVILAYTLVSNLVSIVLEQL